MASRGDTEMAADELIEAFHQGDESRAREAVSRLGSDAESWLARSLESPDARLRRAAVFGFGVLGGDSNLRRLERQLVIEEARADLDGKSVAEVVTQALGELHEAEARGSLTRRLERLTRGAPGASELYTLAHALWKRRHPELLPVVEQALRKLTPSVSGPLQGLHVLLSKSPESLREWAGDASVALADKTQVLAILEADLPEAWLPSLSAFIPSSPSDSSASEREYAECLLAVLLAHRERLLPNLPDNARTRLRVLSLGLLGSQDPDLSLRSAILLQSVGRPEDVAAIEAHRPQDSVGARVFDDAAHALHSSKPTPH
ncbi:hypothetical protein [Myxococcus eversor]|uniref:hypothetical protein n=1 Tax=Myxococcus eversor TaxID=2709661 RepID=UPI0013D4D1ED|nr:hypothetical protein [Myxococcus eversor]